MTRNDVQSLNFAERWLRDGLQVVRPPFSVIQIWADMTRVIERLEALRHEGVTATHTPFLIRAAARALAENSDIHQVIAGSRRLRPSEVNIGLSISGDMFVTPVLVLSDAHKKTVPELVDEIARRIPETQEADRKMHRVLKRWGWIIPFGMLRRACLRVFFTNPNMRNKMTGTLLVSMVAGEWAAGSNFSGSGLLLGGQISSRVTVVDDQPAVRPMASLTLCIDHGVWNGRHAARLLSAIKTELEKGVL